MKYFILIILSFFINCKGQDKDEKTKQREKNGKYYAHCAGNYSTGEALTEKEENWSLNKKEIDNILKISKEISENEWHFSYSITPCNIKIKNYHYNGKNYDLSINGGSYVSLFDGKKTILLGCSSQDCNKYFFKSKETMDENSNTSNNFQYKKYPIDFNRNTIADFVIIKKYSSNFVIEVKVDNNSLITQEFDCDVLKIETTVKYGQAFNLKLEYSDQYQKIFRKVIIPVFYIKKDLVIKKIFISKYGTNAKTGNEEWINKEYENKSALKDLKLDDFF